LADSKYYLYDFWLYEGDESERVHRPQQIVLDFVNTAQSLNPGMPFIVTADSYYGSLSLAEALYDLKVGCLLSCKANMPSSLFTDLLHVNLKKRSWHCIDNKYFSAISVYDKAKLNLLTNLFPADRAIYNTERTTRLPWALYYYRRWLGAVDHFDRQLHLYLYPHRNIKWHQALLPALLKMVVNNTWVVANYYDYDVSLKDVTHVIISHLSGTYTTKGLSNRPLPLQRYDGQDHWSIKTSPNKCAHCKSNNILSNTSYQCSKCDVRLHPECMKPYHTSK
jgi:hypothetical protein